MAIINKDNDARFPGLFCLRFLPAGRIAMVICCLAAMLVVKGVIMEPMSITADEHDSGQINPEEQDGVPSEKVKTEETPTTSHVDQSPAALERLEILDKQAKRWKQMDFTDPNDPVVKVTIRPQKNVFIPDLNKFDKTEIVCKNQAILKKFSSIGGYGFGGYPYLMCRVDTSNGDRTKSGGFGGGGGEIAFMTIETKTRKVEVLISTGSFFLSRGFSNVYASFNSYFLARIVDEICFSEIGVHLSDKLINVLSGQAGLDLEREAYEHLFKNKAEEN